MPSTKIQGINKVKKRLADGSVRYHHYHRATGWALKGELGSMEFLADYVAAEQSMRDRHAGVLNRLIRDYTLSPEFGKLADSHPQGVSADAGPRSKPGSVICRSPPLDDPRVRQDFMGWRGTVSKESGEREADNRLSVLSSMLTWAKENGHILHNHVAGFRRLHKADRSERIWLPEHIEAFMKVAPLELQRALILALHTGQRQADLLSPFMEQLRWLVYLAAPRARPSAASKSRALPL